MRTSEGQSLLNNDYHRKETRRSPVLFFVIGALSCVVVIYFLMSSISTFYTSHSLRSDYSKSKNFDLLIVADLDKKSRVDTDSKGKWYSVMKKGQLTKQPNGTFSIEWVDETKLYTKISEAGRGMELSALVRYNNRLYSFDDRTGLVFEVVNGKAIPRHILMEGDGNNDKGQKTEWATVKDDAILAGSFGKEYTNANGSIANTNNMWVSVIHNTGEITHENWTDRFNKLRKAAGYATGFLPP